MKKLKSFVFSIHRVLGTVICLFFFMWFVSGLVLIYHHFPDITDEQKYEKAESLPSLLPDLHNILAYHQIEEGKVKSLSIKSFQGQALFSIKTKDSTYLFCADTTQDVFPITSKTIDNVVKSWVNAPITKIDTIYQRDQWIMYSSYMHKMPMYKYYFNDAEKHQLYISTKTAEVQQMTDKHQRLWAWIGSIPHKFYIPAIRKNADNWIKLIQTAGIIALLAALSGIYVGADVLYRQYKKRRELKSPYKMFEYKWHHILGLIFGIFMVTFAFSGTMALQKIPQWVIKTHGYYRVKDSQMRGSHLNLGNFITDYRTILAQYPNVKRIKWTHFQDTPVYDIIANNERICIDASSVEPKELFLSSENIGKAIHKLHKKEVYKISLINEYEEYYISKWSKLPLPAYKVTIKNDDHSCYYIDPKTGDFKYLNKSKEAKKWIFSGLHYLNIKWLLLHPILWTIAIWTLCLGGASVSFTGIWLGIKYIIRKTKRKQQISYTRKS